MRPQPGATMAPPAGIRLKSLWQILWKRFKIVPLQLKYAVSPHINNNKECVCKSAIIVCKESLETGCSFTSGTGRGVLVAGPSEDFKTGPDFRSRGSSRHACPLGIKTHFAWLRTEEEEEEGGGWVEPWNVQTFPVDCFLHWLHLGSARTTCALGLLVSVFQEGKRKIFFLAQQVL